MTLSTSASSVFLIVALPSLAIASTVAQGLRFDLLAERAEALLEVLRVPEGLLAVRAQRLFDLAALRTLLQFLEDPDELVLHRQGGSELVAEQLIGGIEPLEHGHPS